MVRPIALRALAASLVLSPLAVPPATAGWSPEPVEVHATLNTCPQVAACEDAANGAFVAWEESDGPLRVAHLLPTGDLDPSWPAFVVASTMGGGRLALRALPDGSGGAYFTWIANESLFVQRVTAAGEIPAPWPEGGRPVRKLFSPFRRPTVVADGEGGLYVSWVQNIIVFFEGMYYQLPSFFLDRRGPDGLTHAGWPPSGKVIGANPSGFDMVASCAIAPAAGGGLWAAWANTSIWSPAGGEIDQAPGAVHLLRLTAAGQPATGWSAQGTAIASYPADAIPAAEKWAWWSQPQASMVAVAEDGRGGVYVVGGMGASDWDGSLVLATKVHHLGDSGSAVAGWPQGGLAVGDQWVPASYGDPGPDGSVSVQAGGHGDAFVGFASIYYTDSPPMYFIAQVEPAGTQALSFGGSRAGWETSRTGDGGFVMASFHPDGQYQYADDVAHVSCWRSGGPGYNEVQSGPPITWYGDVGVTGLRDGGTIFCWSQSNERHGVYAVRLNAAGLVTGVAPPVASAQPRLALRFSPGEGVRASLALAGTGEARLLLADVAGRAVARETFTLEADAREWTISGTASLAPGLYFARVTRGAETLMARVVVTR